MEAIILEMLKFICVVRTKVGQKEIIRQLKGRPKESYYRNKYKYQQYQSRKVNI